MTQSPSRNDAAEPDVRNFAGRLRGQAAFLTSNYNDLSAAEAQVIVTALESAADHVEALYAARSEMVRPKDFDAAKPSGHWEARKALEKESHWTLWRDGHVVFTCWTNEDDARLACRLLNAAPQRWSNDTLAAVLEYQLDPVRAEYDLSEIPQVVITLPASRWAQLITALRAVSATQPTDSARLDWLHRELKVNIAIALKWPAIPQDPTSWRAKLDEAMGCRSDRTAQK